MDAETLEGLKPPFVTGFKAEMRDNAWMFVTLLGDGFKRGATVTIQNIPCGDVVVHSTSNLDCRLNQLLDFVVRDIHVVNTDGLRTLYPLLDMSFESGALDKSSYKRAVTSIGSPQFVNEGANGFLSLSGTGQNYLKVEGTESLHFKSYTLVANVRIKGASSSGTYSTLLSKGTSGSAYGRDQNFQLMVKNEGYPLGRVGFFAYALGTPSDIAAPEVGFNTQKNINDGGWHQLAYTNAYEASSNSNTLNLFVDGVQVETSHKVGNPTEATGPIAIGAWEISSVRAYGVLNGDLDDVTVYDLPLSETEVFLRYQSTKK